MYYSGLKNKVFEHISLKNTVLNEKNPISKDHVFYSSISMKCLEKANLQKKVNQLLLGAKGMGVET